VAYNGHFTRKCFQPPFALAAKGDFLGADGAKRAQFGMKLRYFLNFLIPVVLTLLLPEGALRIFMPLHFPDNYRLYQYDPAAGYRLKSSLHSLRTTDYQEEIITNKNSTVNFQQDFSGYKTLVFASGDSFTDGVGVPADASFPFQLDLLLNVRDDRYHLDYGVVNLGVPGYGPLQEIVRLKEYKEKIGTPRYILFLLCDNDAQDDRNFLSGATHKKLIECNPLYNSFLIRTLSWVKFETEIGKHLTFLGKIRRRRQATAPPTGNLQNNPEGLEPVQNSAEELEPAYQEMINFSRSTGATLILSWMPCNPTTTMPQEYRWLREYCRRHDLAFADWFPVVRAVQEKIPALPHSNSHSAGHYRTWVNAMVARSFAQHIRQAESHGQAGGNHPD
jgi:hypothetical protein